MSTTRFIPGTTTLAPTEIRSSPYRSVSLTAGLFYILTFVSIPTFVLYGPAHNHNFLLGNDSDSSIVIGGLLEIVVALAGIVTAIVLYPVLKKQNEGMALGLVAARVLEAATIFGGVAFLLGLATLHQSGAGQEGLTTSRTLVALYDRIFVLGQGFMPGIDDLLLGLLLYKSQLIPRKLAIIGIIGFVPLTAGYLANMFGVVDRFSPWAGLSALPVAVFEFSLGIYLVVHGFRKSSLLKD